MGEKDREREKKREGVRECVCEKERKEELLSTGTSERQPVGDEPILLAH